MLQTQHAKTVQNRKQIRRFTERLHTVRNLNVFVYFFDLSCKQRMILDVGSTDYCKKNRFPTNVHTTFKCFEHTRADWNDTGFVFYSNLKIVVCCTCFIHSPIGFIQFTLKYKRRYLFFKHHYSDKIIYQCAYDVRIVIVVYCMRIVFKLFLNRVYKRNCDNSIFEHIHIYCMVESNFVKLDQCFFYETHPCNVIKYM